MSEPELSKSTKATPQQVWAVLEDGYRYPEWVKGTKEIRDVEAGWPAPGTSLHYTAGIGPLVKKDRTTSREMVRDRYLELEAVAWPFGSARIALTLDPEDGGTTVRMQEHPLRGIGRVVHTTLTKVGFALRIRVMLDDLVRLAEAEPSPPSPR
ncbi:MAG: SRPBCC family protein [Actinomycetota bacterium]|nr:SRPBCC family protein [Actinomycetota bacterium]